MWLCGSSKMAEGLPLELIAGKEYLIGRDRGCHVRVHDLSVSRRHAVLRPHAREVEIEDLGSSNGTFVGGEAVHKGRLQVGDRFAVGMVSFSVTNSPLAHMESTDTVATTARLRRDEVYEGQAAKLTAAQQKILKLMLDGLDELGIAKQTGSQRTTVHNHIQAIYKALNVHSRRELMSHFLGTTKVVKELPEK